MKVVFYHRKPLANVSYGIEGFFEVVRANLPSSIETRVVVSRFMSTGFIRRVLNMLEAPLRQGDVNHITGDVHYLAFLLRKRRTVLTIHDCGFEKHPSRLRRLLLRWIWLSLPSRRVAAIATDSEFSRGRILSLTRCPPEKVHVVPACISPLFRRIEKQFSKQRPVVLQVGTSPNKNLDRVCEALKGIDCRLRVVGTLSPEQRRMLDASGLDWSNRVGLTTEELLREYGDSDVVVFASIYEGFGLPIIEANMVGRAVITSCLASMPEVAGDAACLVDPYDARSIAAGILRVIDDDAYRELLVEKGFENARRFGPARSAAQYASIYANLAGSSNG